MRAASTETPRPPATPNIVDGFSTFHSDLLRQKGGDRHNAGTKSRACKKKICSIKNRIKLYIIDKILGESTEQHAKNCIPSGKQKKKMLVVCKH